MFFWFSGGNAIFGHDGSILINPSLDFAKLFYSMWSDYFNGTLLSNQGMIVFAGILYLFNLIKLAFVIRAIILSLVFVLPVVSMYYFLRTFLDSTGRNKIYLLVCSSFYGLNFFVVQRWHEVQWAFLISYGLLPLLLVVIYRYLITGRFKYVFSGLLILLLNSINISDPPVIIGYWGITILLLIVLSVVFRKIQLSVMIKRLVIFCVLSFLSVLFVIIPLLYVILGVKSQEFSNTGIGLDYVNLTMQREGILGLVKQMGYFLLYTERYTGGYFYEFINHYFYNPWLILSVFFITILSLSSLLIKQRDHFLSFFSGITIVLGLLLANGIQDPTGGLFRWLFLHIPFFWIFRSPDNKFYPLYLFGISLGLAIFFVQSKIKTKIKNFLLVLTLGAILIYAFPIVLNLVPQPQHRIKIPDDYRQIAQTLNLQKLDFNVAIVNKNYFGDFIWKNDAKFGGANLLLPLLVKGIIWNPADSYSYKNNTEIYNSALYGNLNINERILALLNIKYLILNKDLDYNQLTKATNLVYRENTLAQYEDALKNFTVALENDYVRVYSLNRPPISVFYTPDKILYPNQSGALSSVVLNSIYEARAAIFFNNQATVRNNLNIDKSVDFGTGDLAEETIDNTPVIEYKKIDPTKYRVIIHGAKENFPLVFSESFHRGWKAYLVKSYKVSKVESSNLANYKILDGNEDDQATTDEVKGFINRGYVSTLGDLQEKKIRHDKWVNNKEVLDYNEKYKIDFVSKNFQDTIQNDNLPNGAFYETWFKKPIADNYHIMANGYANSWIIDLDKICGQTTPKPLLAKEGSACVKNADGSYDFEMVVEFWPQQLFYLGLFVSGATLLGCLGFLIIIWRREKRRKEMK
ncbi:MAG: hypothetical protein PHE24_05715 [Patescibacteria group bacterium]|nr:hypothetical protein [Patescibacteria group bacterium]